MCSSATAVARDCSPSAAAAASPAEIAPSATSEDEAGKEEEPSKLDADDDNDNKETPPADDPAEVDTRVRALYYVMQSVEVSNRFSDGRSPGSFGEG